MSTTFDNATHTNTAVTIGVSNDLVFGTNAFWTMSTTMTIVTLLGNNTFRNSGQIYADARPVEATSGVVRVENLTSGIILSSTTAAILLQSSCTVVNAGFISGVSAVQFVGTTNTVLNTGTMTGEENTVDFGFGEGADRLTNSGTIVSTYDDAVQFDGTGLNIVVNHGVISAENSTAILVLGGGRATITNDGVISGFEALSLGLADDVVVNTGTIAGTVLLGSGDDQFDSGGGILSGRVNGGDGEDTLIGGAIGDRLEGANGDDLLIGNGGNDVLRGGAGADDLDGGSGRDTADYGDQVLGLTVDLADASANTGAAAGDAFTAIENLTGTLGDDRLFGDSGGNVLRGNDGADLLDGRGGADKMVGGVGDDIYFVDDARDRTVEVDSSGVDQARTAVSYTCQESIENLVLLGNAAIDGTGNSQANVITGNSAANVLNGAFANDSLTGGGGADTFRFDSMLDPDNNVDTVNDFAVGVDRISLSRTIFTELNNGSTLQAGRFVVGGAALDANDRIIYNATTGVLFYDPDGNGAQAQIAFAHLAVSLPLAASDFVLTG